MKISFEYGTVIFGPLSGQPSYSLFYDEKKEEAIVFVGHPEGLPDPLEHALLVRHEVGHLNQLLRGKTPHRFPKVSIERYKLEREAWAFALWELRKSGVKIPLSRARKIYQPRLETYREACLG